MNLKCVLVTLGLFHVVQIGFYFLQINLLNKEETNM